MNSAELTELAHAGQRPVKKLNVPQFALVVIGAVLIGLFLKGRFEGDWWEFGGFVTGIVGVYLVAAEHIYNWPIGLANVTIYAWVFFQSRLYADMTLQFFFFALGVHGWYQWLHGGAYQTRLSISRIKTSHWGWIALLWVVGVCIYYPIVKYYNGAAPFVDSALTMGSIIAQILLNRKKLENWMIWIAVDIVYIPLFISRELISTAVLYALLLCLAISGLISWHRTYQKEQTA